MARFYFHVKQVGKLLENPEGTDLPDAEAAKQEAVKAARDILSSAIRAGRAKVPEAFVIADEAGPKVDVVPLSTILPDPLKK